MINDQRTISLFCFLSSHTSLIARRAAFPRKTRVDGFSQSDYHRRARAAMRHDPRQRTHMTNTDAKNKPAFPALAWASAAAAVAWTFWPTILALTNKWLHDPGYSHGILVPGFALYLL